MSSFDAFTYVPAAALLAPLAGIGRTFSAAQASRSSTDVAGMIRDGHRDETPRAGGLSMHWRTDSAGVLVMDWSTRGL